MNIVVLDGYALNPGDLSWELLKAMGRLIIYDRTPPELIVERAKDADIIMTNKTPVRENVIAQLPKLRYIGVMATGYDIIDIEAAAEQKIVVTNIPQYGTDSVAQFTFALLLELCHRVGAHGFSTSKGDWSSNPDFSYWLSPQIELAGKTLGIVGAGRIGRRVAGLAAAFGMNVLAVSRTKAEEPNIPQFRWCGLDELWSQSDVVSLHCPLTPETEGIINKQSLNAMKQTAFLINTSRGKLVVEADLAQALEEGRISGAALDVLSKEPPTADNPLIGAKNCIITPHIAWASNESRRRLMTMTADNLTAFLEGTPVNVVN